ncbi:MAG: serine/threonine-protein kinase [Pirellulaceae bacterium]
MNYAAGQSDIILAATDPDLPEKMPQGLEKYRNFQEMARGGNAILQSALDTIVGRTIAIKTLTPELARDRRERRRFLREARVTAQLQHPNTVPVHEIGEDPKQGVYFTMKRISGENFFEVLKRIARGDERTMTDFPLARRLEILAGACQALAYAHARGVIHRDVKPENIWVGNFGEVILLDWGVAKVWGHADINEPIDRSILHPTKFDSKYPDEDENAPAQLQTLTDGGQRPGTPLYMSPEQVEGRRSIDERTDIFSVGVVLYEICAFCEPFKGRTIDETFSNILNKELPPPSERAPQRKIPPAIDTIVMKSIQKDPGKRYQSMRELIAAMREVAAGLAVESI